MKQKYVLGIVALSIVAVLGISMISAFGFGNGFMNSELSDEERTQMQEDREAMQTAIVEGDYESWQELMNSRIAKMQEQITEENFNSVVEHHNKMSEFRTAVEELKNSGDFSKEALQELQEEYGVEGFRKGFMKGFGMGMHMGRGSGNPGECPFAE